MQGNMVDKGLLDYMIALMPNALVDCDGCTRKVKASEAIKREGKYFHSGQCADVALALLHKPQEKGTVYEGWVI